ncbi:MAG: hypothetical protein ABI361_09310 [Nitrososphaera sp.]
MNRLAAIDVKPQRLLILALLVMGDIGTTVIAQYVLRENFVEMGSINSIFIKQFDGYWYIVGYPVELAIFGITAILFFTVWPDKLLNLKFVRLDMWGLTYVQLVILIANNSIAIIIGNLAM